MQILSVQNYSNNSYSNKNIKMKSSNINFRSTNSISKKTFQESNKLATQAIELCEKLFGKFPTFGDIMLAPKEYATRVKENFEYLKFETPSLTLCKKYGNKEAILSVEQPPHYYNAVHGTGKVNLYIRSDKQHLINITFNKYFPKYKDYTEVIEMTSKKECQDIFGGRSSKIEEAGEEDAQMFNEYVSDILKSSEILTKVLK